MTRYYFCGQVGSDTEVALETRMMLLRKFSQAADAALPRAD
jgi:hypothetical protein